jgi:hypothetical protein
MQKNELRLKKLLLAMIERSHCPLRKRTVNARFSTPRMNERSRRRNWQMTLNYGGLQGWKCEGYRIPLSLDRLDQEIRITIGTWEPWKKKRNTQWTFMIGRECQSIIVYGKRVRWKKSCFSRYNMTAEMLHKEKNWLGVSGEQCSREQQTNLERKHRSSGNGKANILLRRQPAMALE